MEECPRERDGQDHLQGEEDLRAGELVSWSVKEDKETSNNQSDEGVLSSGRAS